MNLAVSDKKEILGENLVENLMSEIGPEGPPLKKDEIMPVILDAFMGELVDSSAAAPGPAMGFKVAPYFFCRFGHEHV